MTIKNLHFKWTISRGRDTEGYNICTLYVDGAKVGKCMGGGYDMTGTSFAQWLESTYQTELSVFDKPSRILTDAKNTRSYEVTGGNLTYHNVDGFYGIQLKISPDGKRTFVLDGGCGFESMKRIAEAIGIELKWNKESDRYKNHAFYTAMIA